MLCIHNKNIERSYDFIYSDILLDGRDYIKTAALAVRVSTLTFVNKNSHK